MNTALQPLWAISEELTALLDTIELTPDEQKPEIQAEIDKFLGQQAAKVDQIAHVLAALEYEQNAAADEIERLAERKRVSAAAQKRLEQYVCRVINARGGGKLLGDTNTLSVRASDAVVVTDETLVPAEYIAVKTVVIRSVDKTAIKKALKAGTNIPGVDLEFRDNLTRK